MYIYIYIYIYMYIYIYIPTSTSISISISVSISTYYIYTYTSEVYAQQTAKCNTPSLSLALSLSRLALALSLSLSERERESESETREGESERGRERERKREREREKCCTFEGVIPLHHSPGERRKKVLHLCGGACFAPLHRRGGARVALRLCPPSLFPAVLEQTYLLRLCFRGSDRGPAIIATVKFADLRPCGGPSACKDRRRQSSSPTGLDPTKEKPRDSYDNVGRGSTTAQGS